MAPCMAPLVGMFLGFIIARLIQLVDVLYPGARAVSNPMSADAANDLLVLAFGILGWAIGVVAAHRRLHCGGSMRCESERQKIRIAAHVLLPALGSLIVATYALARAAWPPFLVFLFIFAGILLGEVAEGDPLRYLWPWRAGRD